MIKEDKKIIGTMIDKSAEGLRAKIKETENGLRSEIKATEEGLRSEIKATEEGLRKEIKSTEEGLRKEINAVENRLGQDIRHNGFMMERMEESIQQISEGYEFIRAGIEQINAKLDYHRVERVDILWEKVKEHSKRIKKLETAKAN